MANAYTSGSVLTRVRRQLEDVGPSYKWRDSELYLYISDGRDDVVRRRPDASTTDSVAITDLTPITTDTSLAVDDMFVPQITDYACYRAHLKRAPFADPNKASAYKKLYEEAMGA